MPDLLDHFTFHAIPFTCEIDISKSYHFEANDHLITELRRTVERRMSAALIGPAGTGKTFVLRQLCGQLPEARYRLRYLKVTDLSKRDMCREIASVVGIQPAGTYPTLVRKLQDSFMSTATSDGLRPVLIIDEAHDMRPSVLSMLRLLTNFEMDSKLVVSFILAGQPALQRILERNEMADIAQRLAYCGTLRLLSREETRDYLAHRIRLAGSMTDLFAKEAVEAIFEMSRGNLRAIDFIALRSLQGAADAASPMVEVNHVVTARGGRVQ